jgi:hypothetical protein
MARSTRAPFWCDNNGPGAAKYWKRQANKKARKTPVMADGMAYRKVYCSWNIHDYKWYDSDRSSKARRK